jgi:hypothetical protein
MMLLKSTFIFQTPAKSSLLKLSAEEEKIAVEMFQNIMRLMGDYPIPNGTSIVEVAHSLVLNGLNLSADFQTEIYCQLLRQLYGNPHVKRYLMSVLRLV